MNSGHNNTRINIVAIVGSLDIIRRGNITVDVVVGDELVLPEAGERGNEAPEEGADDDVAAVRRCVVLFISFISSLLNSINLVLTFAQNKGYRPIQLTKQPIITHSWILWMYSI